MPYDPTTAERLRRALSGYPGVTERKMFGGLTFQLGGQMCCGVIGQDLVVRVGSAAYQAALAEPHARVMDFTGRPLRGFVYVGPVGFARDRDLKAWVERGVRFVRTLPPK